MTDEFEIECGEMRWLLAHAAAEMGLWFDVRPCTLHESAGIAEQLEANWRGLA